MKVRKADWARQDEYPSSRTMRPMRKSPETVLAMARKPQRLPDYFTPEEASALVAAAPNYQVRMAAHHAPYRAPGVRVPLPPARGPPA